MRKIAALFLAFVILGGICGCSTADRVAQLSGTWETTGYYDGDAMMELFVYMDLYEEEMALMDPAGIAYVQTMTFGEDLTYTIACDTDRSIALAREYYMQALDAFYEHREELEGCYGVSFGVMGKDSFFKFYAELYGVEDYEALIDLLTESTVDPDYLAEGEETGTYRVTPWRIYCTIDGEEGEQYIPYRLEDGILTLEFFEGEQAYTRK